jgi:hypothetical protein
MHPLPVPGVVTLNPDPKARNCTHLSPANRAWTRTPC